MSGRQQSPFTMQATQAQPLAAAHMTKSPLAYLHMLTQQAPPCQALRASLCN